jgi:hypothetical protein
MIRKFERLARQFLLLVLGTISLSLLGMSARGDTITYYKGPPLYSPVSDQAAWTADSKSSLTTQAADYFDLAPGAERIYNIHFWGVYKSGVAPATDAFSMQLYNSNTNAKLGPVPSPSLSNEEIFILGLTRTPTGTFIGGLPVYEYDARIRYYWGSAPYLEVGGGGERYLAISNNSGGNEWAWAQSQNSGGHMYLRSAATNQFVATNKSMAFYFTVIPEPSTWIMAVLSGLGMVGVMARRKRFAQRR